MKPKLTENERKVLKYLIQDARMPCTQMARKLGITSQAVGKIMDKLEKEGIVVGYTTKVDYRKLGVDVFAIAFFHFKSGEWSNREEEDLMKRVRGPHLIGVYRVTEGDFTHMVIYGFRSIEETEHYFHHLQKNRGHVSELKKFYILSADSVFKNSSEDLLLKIIDELEMDKLAEPEMLIPIPRADVAHTGFFS